MTQTLDIAKAEAPELNRWLAEQPCPQCGGQKGYRGDDWDMPRLCTVCKGTGLAFPWASEKCLHQNLEGVGWEQDCSCNGSGRVPRNITIEDVLDHASRDQRRRILVGLAAQEKDFKLETVRLFVMMQNGAG